MDTLRRLFRHLSTHRELYVFPTLGILMAWLGIHFVVHLTGRGVLDDPGVIVAWLYNFIGLMLVVLAVGQVQHHLIGFRGQKDGATFRDDIFDTCVTFILLGFFSYLLLFR